jgi:hypothetical protein
MCHQDTLSLLGAVLETPQFQSFHAGHKSILYERKHNLTHTREEDSLYASEAQYNVIYGDEHSRNLLGCSAVDTTC